MEKRLMIMTQRYASNLLKKGRNNEFTLIELNQHYSQADNVTVGHYYLALIGGPNRATKDAVGVTPLRAVERCLEKHGVTFR